MKIDSNREVSISLEITERKKKTYIGSHHHCSYILLRKEIQTRKTAKPIRPKRKFSRCIIYTKIMIAFWIWSVVWSQILYSFTLIINNKMIICDVRSLTQWDPHNTLESCALLTNIHKNTHTMCAQLPNYFIIALLLCLSTIVSELFFIFFLLRSDFLLLYYSLLFIRHFFSIFFFLIQLKLFISTWIFNVDFELLLSNYHLK